MTVGRGPFLGIVLLLALFVGVPVWLLQKRSTKQPAPAEGLPRSPATLPTVESLATSSPSATLPVNASPQTTPTPNQIATPTPLSEPTSQPTKEIDQSYAGKVSLIIPVAGINRDQLKDTFTEARSEGRVHDAIDIPAPQGTPVLAAADGEIARLFQSERGGTTIYQLSTDKKLVYYYAHLQRYADGVAAGRYVRQGEVIAYVGDTGNAGSGNYHLHFSIAVLSDPKRYWEGTNINPYPLLHK
ncbi:MAG TPA: peptidoglycan DD-metalloendopeptidase family protein [Pyrinomonadaceae bacterium]